MSVQVARQLRIVGRVQGVGFRPFVKRLATQLGLAGWVRNDAGAVSIFVQGRAAAIDAFAADVIAKAPPLARPSLAAFDRVPEAQDAAFAILPSRGGDVSGAVVPPDLYACDECLAELRSPGDRRYRYPFINCTQCGPRYTIIRSLPYDRPRTTMAGFPLCAECAAEYADAGDRRYHAQPLACPVCGPRLSFRGEDGETIEGNDAALEASLSALRRGLIVAAKGIGGYHLLCDARSAEAVARLRRRKRRPEKPLAVMVRAIGSDDLDEARRCAILGESEAAMLRDPIRPIVLVAKRPGSGLSEAIAPGLAEIGLMLPYSPLHALLTEGFGGPMVATSGNISGEPVIIDVAEADARLGRIADAFLHHDRPIERPADDAVFRVSGGRARPLRLGRGVAPLLRRLPLPVAVPTLATGGHLKATVALAWGECVAISPHIGDLGSVRSLDVFEQVIGDLQRLYGIQAERVVCDAHPGYASTRWAGRSGIRCERVFHHHAHAAALTGEHGCPGPVLVFTWDGVGYGEDGTLWGGEALLGGPAGWGRVAMLRPFRLPGGERAAREPWRCALGLCWEAGEAWSAGRGEEEALLRRAWAGGLNAPVTTAAGRLFDAAAALTGLTSSASFEGQGPMQLEAASRSESSPIGLPLSRDERGILVIDWAPLLPMLRDARASVGERGGILHASLAQAICDVARAVRGDAGVARVGLTGGVFQNRLLLERAAAGLRDAGFEVMLPTEIPANDASISFGQIIETAARDAVKEPA